MANNFLKEKTSKNHHTEYNYMVVGNDDGKQDVPWEFFTHDN